MYNRFIKLPKNDSFFLWGPRQTGKSSLLRQLFPDSPRIDLLKSDEFIKYSTAPWLLREELTLKSDVPFIIIDEIQKVPALLDEIHWLIEEKEICFGLCGSSARKVKRGHANLLGGRALRYVLHGLTSHELGSDFNLENMLNRGYLPRMVQSSNYKKLWHGYIVDYLKEEIASEGLVRNLPAFSNFLELASISDTEIISYKKFESDTGVVQTTIKDYFSILQDTLIGSYLPSFSKRPKRRVIQAPKFFFFDVGLVNQLARRGEVVPKTEVFGKAFENWVYHEIRAYLDYTDNMEPLSYWQLSSGKEVDFIIGDARVAIEAKGSDKITSDHCKGLEEFKRDYKKVKNRYLVSLVDKSRKIGDIVCLSIQDFTTMLWSGNLF